LTLLAALQRTGGGTNALAREAAAALLNAAHLHIAYAFTEAQVIAMAQAAYASPGFVDATTNLLAAEDGRGGDLTTGGRRWDWTSPGLEGLSPPYWSQHTTAWAAPYTTGASFNTIFGVTQEPGLTLLAALQCTGGGTQALARQAVGALLSAAAADVNFFYSE